ncbi:hypothetical protein BA6E_125283 [Bacteroidales bacterium 6E]|nr:hypothetical protein BA6E_125283 [Bacteroidales bacterium 6E]
MTARHFSHMIIIYGYERQLNFHQFLQTCDCVVSNNQIQSDATTLHMFVIKE